MDAQHDLSSQQPLNSATLCSNGKSMTNWHFEEHLLNSDYCAAIAFRNCQPEVGEFQQLSLDDVIVEQEDNLANQELIEYCKNALKKQRKLT